MKTQILMPTVENIKKASEVIKKGGLVAFPTETVYGLGANGLNEAAVKKIYETKGRPSDNPMILHIAEYEDLRKLVKEVNSVSELLSETFWPGPLTLVLKKKDKVPSMATGGLDTVAVRMPAHPVALALIKESGTPIAAPSANLSGRPSPTRAKDVLNDLNNRVEIILEGGDCEVGIESTVVDLTKDGEILILRPGLVTKGEIEEALNTCGYENTTVGYAKEEDALSPKSPGMKYTHYSPKAEMIILKGSKEKVLAEIERIKKEGYLGLGSGNKTGVIYFKDLDAKQAVKQFFAKLRDLDEEGVELIISVAPDKTDEVAYALMNRMLKASGYKVIKV